MNRSKKFKYLILILLLIAVFLYFSSSKNSTFKEKEVFKKTVPETSTVQVVESAPAEQKGVSTIAAAASFDQSSKNDVTSEFIENPTFAEMVAKRGRNFIDGCGYFDRRSWQIKSIEYDSKNGEKGKESFNRRTILLFKMATNHFMMSLPAMAPFSDSLDNNTVLSKAEVSRLNAKLRVELEQNIETANLVALRAYYVLILQRVAFANPQLVGDSELQNTCEKIQNIDAPMSRGELNTLVQSLMLRAQVRPSEVKFNSQFQPRLKILDKGDGPYYSQETDKDIL